MAIIGKTEELEHGFLTPGFPTSDKFTDENSVCEIRLDPNQDGTGVWSDAAVKVTM